MGAELKYANVGRRAMYRGVKAAVFLNWCTGLASNVDECAM